MLDTYRKQVDAILSIKGIANLQKLVRNVKRYYMIDLYDISLLTADALRLKKRIFKSQVQSLILHKQQFLLNLLQENQVTTITRQTIMDLENSLFYNYNRFF